MADRLLRVFGHQAFQVRSGLLVFEMGRPRPRKCRGKFRPSIRGTHVDNAYRLDARLRWLNAEQGRGLAILDTAPKFPLGGNDEVLVKRIGVRLDLYPLAAAGNDREHRPPRRNDPHVVLDLRHIFFRRRFLRERPRQHEFALEHITTLDATIESRRHPAKGWMANPLLDVGDDPPCIGLVPAPVKLLGGEAELHNQVAGQVLRLDFAAFFPPEALQGRLVIAHNDPGVGAAYKGTP